MVFTELSKDTPMRLERVGVSEEQLIKARKIAEAENTDLFDALDDGTREIVVAIAASVAETPILDLIGFGKTHSYTSEVRDLSRELVELHTKGTDPALALETSEILFKGSLASRIAQNVTTQGFTSKGHILNEAEQRTIKISGDLARNVAVALRR